jgi:DHA2 family multidrug resistance protein-like MFS transporter
VTYGLIRAGEDGWGNPGVLLTILVGIGILVGFLAWERRLTRRPGGQALLDMTLFSSASFTWGAILAAMSFLSLIGVLSSRCRSTSRACSAPRRWGRG